jgi:hypothetical protein
MAPKHVKRDTNVSFRTGANVEISTYAELAADADHVARSRDASVVVEISWPWCRIGVTWP